MKKPIEWLYDYFLKKNRFTVKDYEDRIGLDIFDSGLIDSFGIIELITELECTFDIELKAEDMQDTNLRTIKGMAGIIERRLKAES